MHEPDWWVDETSYPGPPHHEATLEDFSRAILNVGRAYGKAFAQMAQAMEKIAKELQQAVQTAEATRALTSTPPLRSIPPRKMNTGPRSDRAWDHRGRRRY